VLLAFFRLPDGRHGNLEQERLYPIGGLVGAIVIRQPSRLEEISIMTVKAIPEGQPRITAYLGLQDANAAIKFYTEVFGAHQMFRLDTPDDKVGHAELRIGESALMLADTCDQSPFGKSQDGLIALHLYVENVDACFKRAINKGAIQISAIKDQFYGDRTGTLRDPYGVIWFVATHKEDLTPDEIRERAAKVFN
jgi:PhnB protein